MSAATTEATASTPVRPSALKTTSYNDCGLGSTIFTMIGEDGCTFRLRTFQTPA